MPGKYPYGSLTSTGKMKWASSVIPMEAKKSPAEKVTAGGTAPDEKRCGKPGPNRQNQQRQHQARSDFRHRNACDLVRDDFKEFCDVIFHFVQIEKCRECHPVWDRSLKRKAVLRE